MKLSCIRFIHYVCCLCFNNKHSCFSNLVSWVVLWKMLGKRTFLKPTNSPVVGRDRVDLNFIKVPSRRNNFALPPALQNCGVGGEDTSCGLLHFVYTSSVFTTCVLRRDFQHLIWRTVKLPLSSMREKRSLCPKASLWILVPSRRTVYLPEPFVMLSHANGNVTVQSPPLPLDNRL